LSACPLGMLWWDTSKILLKKSEKTKVQSNNPQIFKNILTLVFVKESKEF
jgi:hypothetical protein